MPLSSPPPSARTLTGGACQNNGAVLLDYQSGVSAREIFRQTYEVNVFGVAATFDAFLPLLEKSSFPRVVNVSSSMGSISFQLTPDTGYPVEQQIVRRFAPPRG